MTSRTSSSACRMLAAVLTLASPGAHAAMLSLVPGAEPAALESAGKAASQPSASGPAFSHPSLLTAQSFRILSEGRVVGNLVSGRGTLPPLSPDASPIQGCFVALVKTGGQTTVVSTIGAGDWEAESCNGVAAVGLLPDGGGSSRAALIYKTSSPHESPVEPVVVAWSEAQGLSIDAAATKRASLAGADSLAKLRTAIR